MRTGRLMGEHDIDFHDSKPLGDVEVDNDDRAAVALSEDGIVIVAFAKGTELFQCTGTLSGDNVAWSGPPVYYDDGINPSVALAADLAIEMHQGEELDRLWFATSLLTDRANWMHERLPSLGGRSLRQLVLPGSHDSGMYVYGISVLGKTQSLSFGQQLAYGIRWFDVRLTWDEEERKFYIYHELEEIIRGPELRTMLEELYRFAKSGPKELAIFKLSHFKNIHPETTYRMLVDQISGMLDPWLYKELPEGQRLADVPLSESIADRTVYLFVVDATWAVEQRVPGIWCYRDVTDPDAMQGDLRVFDRYAETPFATSMEADQRRKFEEYDGLCKYEENNTIIVTGPCDLFLNDWVVTSPFGAGVWSISKDPNRHLGESLSEAWTIPNPRGFIINIVYVDYVEFARVTDVVLFLNGTPLPES